MDISGGSKVGNESLERSLNYQRVKVFRGVQTRLISGLFLRVLRLVFIIIVECLIYEFLSLHILNIIRPLITHMIIQP